MFVCFTLTSESWIGWLYRIMAVASPTGADAVTMVGGYTCQVLGLVAAAACAALRPACLNRGVFVGAVGAHFVLAMLALSATSLAPAVAWGFLMSICCGIVASFYLMSLAQLVPENRRGIVFGGGYAYSTVATWLLSLVQGDFGFVFGLVVCAALSALAIAVALGGQALPNPGDPPPHASSREPSGEATSVWRIVWLGCITVILMSLAKNLGFGFPSADLGAGVSVEFERLFYAAGLVIAGVVTDRNRHYGALCCMAALVTPFALLALAGEPISGVVLWAVDYFFYGFFSVFRVVLFADVAARERFWFLACFGLAAGRVGDALGTALRLGAGENTVALVIMAAAAFMATIVAFYLLSQLIFHTLPKPEDQQAPATAAIHDADLAFERFSARYELSAREREVLREVLADKTNAEIASELFVQEGTVKFHVRNVLKKTGCANRRELRAAYLDALE